MCLAEESRAKPPSAGLYHRPLSYLKPTGKRFLSILETMSSASFKIFSTQGRNICPRRHNNGSPELEAELSFWASHTTGWIGKKKVVGKYVTILPQVVNPEHHWNIRLLLPSSLLSQWPVVKASEGPCNHQELQWPWQRMSGRGGKPLAWCLDERGLQPIIPRYLTQVVSILDSHAILGLVIHTAKCLLTIGSNPKTKGVNKFLVDILQVTGLSASGLSLKPSNDQWSKMERAALKSIWSSKNLDVEAKVMNFLIWPRWCLGTLSVLTI